MEVSAPLGVSTGGWFSTCGSAWLRGLAMGEPEFYLETDGSVRPGERHKHGERPPVGGAGIVLWDPELRVVLAESVHLERSHADLKLSCERYWFGLRRARERRVERLSIRSDCLSSFGTSLGRSNWRRAGRYLSKRSSVNSSAHLPLSRPVGLPSTHAVERRAGVPTADYLARQAVGLGPRKAQRRVRVGSV